MSRDSFITQHIRRIDAHLDRLQLSSPHATLHDDGDNILSQLRSSQGLGQAADQLKRISTLQELTKALSTTSSPTAPISSAYTIVDVLRAAQLSREAESSDDVSFDNHHVHLSRYEEELEWSLLMKAAVQGYGAVLKQILDQTLAANEHIWYWDDILTSHRWATVYSMQTSPLRFWSWLEDIWQSIVARDGVHIGQAEGWRRFLDIFKEALLEKTLMTMKTRVLSPLAQIHIEAKNKQEYLFELKDVSANALGVLVGEGLEFVDMNGASKGGKELELSASSRTIKIQSSVAKSVALLEAVLLNVKDTEPEIDNFESRISECTNDDLYFSTTSGTEPTASLRPRDIGVRLENIMHTIVAQSSSTFETRLRLYGRPSVLTRYWLPATALLLGSGTILRITVQRKAEILTWIRELGQTSVDFWMNWVVEPARRIIATIRHDEGSEVAIMSKGSLEGDRASLERMVVDFVKQNPRGSSAPSQAEIDVITSKIREGDLTPVLRAYEKDIEKPFVGAIRGNLVRALLIQVQKTKVDIEVAMGGIDSILKSQELVFGFVSLTPGILVTLAVFRYINSTFGSRQGQLSTQKQNAALSVLRRIDRILTIAQPSEFGVLYYKDYGQLLTEAHILQQVAGEALSETEYRSFLKDLDMLCNVKSTPKALRKIKKRLRWDYRW